MLQSSYVFLHPFGSSQTKESPFNASIFLSILKSKVWLWAFQVPKVYESNIGTDAGNPTEQCLELNLSYKI